MMVISYNVQYHLYTIPHSSFLIPNYPATNTLFDQGTLDLHPSYTPSTPHKPTIKKINNIFS